MVICHFPKPILPLVRWDFTNISANVFQNFGSYNGFFLKEHCISVKYVPDWKHFLHGEDLHCLRVAQLFWLLIKEIHSFISVKGWSSEALLFFSIRSYLGDCINAILIIGPDFLQQGYMFFSFFSQTEATFHFFYGTRSGWASSTAPFPSYAKTAPLSTPALLLRGTTNLT